MREGFKRAVDATGFGDRARKLKRAFEPASTTRDRRDHEHLGAILGAVLAPDSNCVDVGAHAGDVLADFCRLAPNGRHVAVEPLPHMAAILRERFPGVDVREVALGREPGPAEFAHVVTRPGWSGFRERPTPGGGGDRVEKITVTVERLDDTIAEGYRPDLVKIDVEGAELGVLQGARDTLTAHHPIVIFEHGLGSADHYGTRPHDVFDLLDGLGYRILDLDGQGPYTRAGFIDCFDAQGHTNFLARV
jgi:FkbM family methyltransferase